VMLCMDSHLDPLLVLMIETPHPVHTHSRASLYIYKVFEHLQQWLRVIRVELQPDIPYVCFALCRSKLSAECSQPKINSFFNRIDPLETSPCELSSAVKKNE
jgi:hypothetical protein